MLFSSKRTIAFFKCIKCFHASQIFTIAQFPISNKKYKINVTELGTIPNVQKTHFCENFYVDNFSSVLSF